MVAWHRAPRSTYGYPVRASLMSVLAVVGAPLAWLIISDDVLRTEPAARPRSPAAGSASDASN
jgi:hypothetical protein